MKKQFLLLGVIILTTVMVSGCTNPTTSISKTTPQPTVEPETTLVPVKAVEPMLSASPSAAIDQTIDETDKMVNELGSDKFADLPSDL